MKTWEYMSIQQGFSDADDIIVAAHEGAELFVEDLNTLGSQGWELVTIYGDDRAILKREITNG